MITKKLNVHSPFPEIPLSVHQRLCGGLFGDGSLDYFRNRETGTIISARYRDRQGLLHRDWVENQFQKLYPLTNGIKSPQPKQDKNGYWFIQARTTRSSLLTVYAEAFYQQLKDATGWKAIKGVPVNSGELLANPLSLAAWIAGDGRPKANGDFTLCTQGFTFEENEFLAEILLQNFGVPCKVVFYSNGKKYYPELYIQKRDAKKLLSLCDKEIASLPSIKHRFLY